MRRVAFAGLMIVGVGSGLAQDVERVSVEERSRFVFFAVLEGLWEDGADPVLVRRIAEDADGYFVPKCPICLPVQHAVKVYVGSEDVPGFRARGEGGLPAEAAAGLKDKDVNARRAALESLVASYVNRRFDRLRMEEKRREGMREALQRGMKEGMRLFDESPLRDYGRCPSCAGGAGMKK